MIALLYFLSTVCCVFALYTSSDDVVLFSSPAEFNKQVVSSNDPWLIEFYAPWCGHCKNLAPDWKKAATSLKGILRIGAVDMDANPSIGQPYGIQGFPTIKFFGSNKQSPSDYQGGRTAEAIVDFGLQELKSIAKARLSGKAKSGGSGKSSSSGDSGKSEVVELTASNFDQKVLQSSEPWLVEFYAPWCGHCKNLAPHWAAASSRLKGKVNLGAVDATVHTALGQKYGIKGYPTIKVFPAGAKGEPLNYDGPRTTEGIVSYGNSMAGDSLEAPEILELTDATVFEKQCGGKPLCVVLFLPHILDSGAQGRNAHISMLKAVAEKFKRKPFTYLWTEAMQQPELEQVLGIGGYGYPALSVLNTLKKRYATMILAITQDGVGDFLQRLFSGTEPTSELKFELSSIKKVQPWDGKDAALAQDDEIDLSELYGGDLPKAEDKEL